MVADDADASDIGLYRQHQAKAPLGGASLTPNLDGIGRKGVAMASAHAAAPLCAPSRFAILTGLRPYCSHTVTALKAAAAAAAASATVAVPPLVSYDTAPRASRHPTLAARLGALGYATGIFGMWHLGAPTSDTKGKDRTRVEETPPERFAVAAGGKVRSAVKAEYASVQEHVKRVGGFEEAERLYAAPLDAEGASGVILPSKMKVHNVEWVVDGAAKFIQSKGGLDNRPFFLYIGFTLPHGPDADRSMRDKHLPHTPAGMWPLSDAVSNSHIQVRNEVRKRATEALATGGGAGSAGRQGHKDYGLALAWLDRGVGTVLWAMQRRGVAHNTLLAFTSDHGSTDKSHCYSRATLTPLLMQWPDVLAAGTWITQPVSLLDVAATFLHVATDATNSSLFSSPGRAVPSSVASPPLHGVSLLPLLLTTRPLFPPKLDFRIGVPDNAIERHIICEAGHTRSLMTARWRYIYAPRVGRAGTRGVGVGESYGVGTRHPAASSAEQLYDLSTDPDESKELIGAYGLLVASSGLPQPPLAAKELEAAEALAAFRQAMHRDLMGLAAACGV